VLRFRSRKLLKKANTKVESLTKILMLYSKEKYMDLSALEKYLHTKNYGGNAFSFF